MKILINDYCGHPFQFDLSKELVKRGHKVLHMFTYASGGPKANFNEKFHNVEVVDVSMQIVNKQNFIKRWFQESNYGIKAIKVIERFQPNVVISANTPMAAQRKIVHFCNKERIKFVFWLQDIISIAVQSILTRKLGPLGKIIGAVFKSIERNILKRSDHIVTIADDFVVKISDWGINKTKSTVIPNWSPIEQIPVLPKVNTYSLKHNIDHKFVVLYSGTMGMKHNPHIISEAAKNLQDNSDIIFVVITDGIGMDVLKKEKEALSLDNLLLLPFQSFEIFPQVLASGDVLLTILEEDAGMFSVPSKVWSGYCAGRTSLLVVPEENLAAKRTKEINAGIVLPNDQSNKLSEKILYLKSNPSLCNIHGKNARDFAEAHFKIDKIADRFEAILNNLHE